MNIKYNDFERHMKDIAKIQTLQNEIWEACSNAYTNTLDCEIAFPTLTDNVIELLTAATGDKEDWISYFVYELQCGENYKPGMITTKDGEEIPLRTIMDLWQLLNEQ